MNTAIFLSAGDPVCMKTRLAPLDGVLIHVMKDLHDAEGQLRGILPLLWEKAHNKDLAETLREFLHESTRQELMLAGMLVGLGEHSPDRPWQGMRATLEETGAVITGVEDGATTDLLLISGCLRIKGLKIAAYGTARSVAEKRGNNAMARLLEDVLNCEMHGDLKLVEFAHTALVTLGMAAL